MQKGQVFLFVFIAVVLCLLLYLFKNFLMTIVIGSLMAVATSNLNARLLTVFKGKKIIATFISTLLLLLLFFVPFTYATIKLAMTLKDFDINTITQTINYIQNYNFDLPHYLDFLKPMLIDIINNLDINSLSKNALTFFSTFTKSSLKFIVDMFLIVIFYFFANLYGTSLISYLKSIVPIDKNEFQEVLSEVSNVMAVVFYSMVLVAVFEGILFGFITMFFGYDGILMSIVFAFSSLIPAIGGALVYVPISLYKFALNDISAALWILLYSFIVISIIADTFIKPLIIKWINKKLVSTPTKVNELLIFLSMIAGISSFGFWGIILGPAILTFFISTLKMYVILKDKNLL